MLAFLSDGGGTNCGERIVVRGINIANAEMWREITNQMLRGQGGAGLLYVLGPFHAKNGFLVRSIPACSGHSKAYYPSKSVPTSRFANIAMN